MMKGDLISTVRFRENVDPMQMQKHKVTGNKKVFIKQPGANTRKSIYRNRNTLYFQENAINENSCLHENMQKQINT